MTYLLHNLSLRAKLLLFATVIQIALLLTGGIIYNETVQSQQRSLVLLRTIRIINTTEALQAQLSTMDMSARGYMLTGNPIFIDPYGHASYASDQLLGQLQGQIQDEPSQIALLTEIGQHLQAWRTNFLSPGLTQREALTQTDPAAEATLTQRAGEAKRTFDRLQVRFDTFRSYELDQVEQRQQEARQSAEQLRITLIICTVLLVMGSLVGFWLLASRIARRVQRVTQAARRMADGDLSTRCHLQSGHDEIGQMAETFNTMASTLEEHASSLEIQYRAAEEARRDAEQAHAQLAAQLSTIEHQQNVIREMSVPVLPLTNTTLVMPLVGALDSERLLQVQSQALQALERSRARQLILDVTGIPVVDTQIARGLLEVTKMAELLGSQVFVVGIRPEVAQALVALDMDFAHFRTYSTLQQGIAYTLGHEAPQHRRRVIT
jgi:rsbT co-antagonist protein RsbR